jgi:hypothetical protein
MLPLNILNNARITVAMAKYFKGVSSITTNAETQDTPKYCISGRNIRGLHICVDLSNNLLNTLDNFKTWLTNNSVVVYYVLATPTYTLLNDTLQNQLDNLQYALAYDDKTYISQTNTDLPFIIDAETYAKINVDLTNYVKNTDYASSSKGGVIKTGYSSNIDANGNLYATNLSYTNYQNVGANHFISKGTLENVITGKELVTNQDLNVKQNIIDNTLITINKTIPTAINEVNSIAKGANQAVGYSNYQTMVTALNSLNNDEYIMGQNIYIVSLNVPDLWISEVMSSSSTYTYVDDATFINELSTNGYVQVGYYKLSALETQKVDLTDYVKNTDYATSTTAGTFKVSNGVVVGSTGYISCNSRTFTDYNNLTNNYFISKGTLENVLRGYGIID